MTERTTSANTAFHPSSERIRVAVVSGSVTEREKLSELLSESRRFRLVGSVGPKHAVKSITGDETDLIVGHAKNENEFGAFLEVANSLAQIPSLLFVSRINQSQHHVDNFAVNAIAEINDLSERRKITEQLHAISDQPIVTGVPKSVIQQRDEKLLASLTEREREVLVLTANGLSMKEIAQQLKRSYGTVASHRASLMEKTSIHDKVGLARFAIRSRLVAA